MERTYAIGDIHGRHDLLTALLDAIQSHAGGQPHRLVFLGDYIDRGPDSAGVVETVRALNRDAPERVVCLKGNHEAMLLKVIAKPSSSSWWVGNGGDKAMASWGVHRPSDIPRDVISWLRKLPTLHEDGWRYFVHAGLEPGCELERQTEETKLWIRQPFLDTDFDFGKRVVHGHTPVSTPLPDLRPFRTNLDTGAAYGGRLTAGIFTNDQGPPTGFLQVPSPRPRRGGVVATPQASRGAGTASESGSKLMLTAPSGGRAA